MRTRKREALPFTVEVDKQRIAKGEKDFREREKKTTVEYQGKCTQTLASL